MWNYEKRLQYPVNIKTPNAKLAQFISSQYGGPDGEIGASMRYLSQRFTAPEISIPKKRTREKRTGNIVPMIRIRFNLISSVLSLVAS